ncbi:MAG: hypothetical protein B6I26_00460 [Desulfobacteraceae bacterium 4572_130]|nr:MAG: hypothetical protein B6I26_00460 [Desulfobacteraceae bacterium 4572_130]
MGAIYGACPNCGASSTGKSGSPVNIFQCKKCGSRFCGYCASGKGGVFVRTFKCPNCNSDSTKKIGQTRG